MPQFAYRGRDKNGLLRKGERFAVSADDLGNDLFKEGITPIDITVIVSKVNILESLTDLFQNNAALLEDLAMFARQMQLLHKAGVPIITAIRQIASFSRNAQLAKALNGCIEYLEKGEKLSSAMTHYPKMFSKLMVNIVQIGESTGHLSEAFEHLHGYLDFEAKNSKQIKGAFRYPIFVCVAVLIAIVVLNIFVIPTFAKFYGNMETSLPWQTSLLIGMSNLFVYYGIYLLILFIGISYFTIRYLNTPAGRYNWNKFQLRIPIIGRLIKRLILIRFSESLAIILNSGISVIQGLTLVTDLLQNAYIKVQVDQSLELIQRGNTFTQSISSIELFTPLELQIISVGEKNGELGAAMKYIGNFHSQEIEYDLKRMTDLIGPIMIAIVSVLILILAMGIYLPIWNMINTVHT